MLANIDFLNMVAEEKRYTFISTGMSSFDEIDRAVEVFRNHNCPFELMHCNSTYPMPNSEANLRMIGELRDKYHCNVGYSGHETGRTVSYAAAVLGATSIERHITLDRAMYGSDQAASLDVRDLERLTHDIANIPNILGTGEKIISESELAVRRKLRGY